ncbi:hypothetical protein B0H17DRAFT_1142553 [Mycena rosella]|uniref:Uncharacterized protein n=1 Tax=Mycena rosella TaxID=1033263 RepID=A0AAD7D0Z0_MYCRO|nr:hypothetical protein B0H17DRAFT_1142553 [Mycena rosella]
MRGSITPHGDDSNGSEGSAGTVSRESNRIAQIPQRRWVFDGARVTNLKQMARPIDPLEIARRQRLTAAYGARRTLTLTAIWISGVAGWRRRRRGVTKRSTSAKTKAGSRKRREEEGKETVERTDSVGTDRIADWVFATALENENGTVKDTDEVIVIDGRNLASSASDGRRRARTFRALRPAIDPRDARPAGAGRDERCAASVRPPAQGVRRRDARGAGLRGLTHARTHVRALSAEQPQACVRPASRACGGGEGDRAREHTKGRGGAYGDKGVRAGTAAGGWREQRERS